MAENSSTDRSELLAHTVEIVRAYVSNNAISGSELPALIQAVFDRLAMLDAGEPEPAAAPSPTVPIRRSVTDDNIVCLECGRKLKMLKRHLMSDHDLTPEQYRTRWGLPYDYPMLAPAHARTRRELALSIGLGRKPEPPPKPKRQRQQGRLTGYLDSAGRQPAAIASASSQNQRSPLLSSITVRS